MRTAFAMFGKCRHAAEMKRQRSFSAAQNAGTRSGNTLNLRFSPSFSCLCKASVVAVLCFCCVLGFLGILQIFLNFEVQKSS